MLTGSRTAVLLSLHIYICIIIFYSHFVVSFLFFFSCAMLFVVGVL